ncbi:MAG TPA: ABC transporter permease, partial [Chitinophagaceae bacterium]|nr:ABC transporter permease [Chitinophagaceae bacterium]
MANHKRAGFSWTLLMAWRDSRKNRSRLFLFISSIILGIAALVSIYSLGDVLQEEIDAQAASLLGADLEISGNKPIRKALGDRLVDSIGDRRSEQRSFPSMIYFNKSGGTRLIEVKALGGEYPYYGDLETVPVTAARTFRKGQFALVDQTLMLQFNAQQGDTIKLGALNFVIAGTLMGAPGQTGLSASVAPVVYIPLSYLAETGLEQKGSRINYRYYFKYDKPVNMEALIEGLQPRLEEQGLWYDTIESQKEDTAESFADVTRFLSLIGFIALLLGCIGVASAIHIYVREKINTIAVLRCLGAKASQAFFIYLVQIAGIGLIGSVIGAALGSVIQQFLPVVLKEFLPIELKPAVSWTAIGQGIVLGLIISILFAMLPLVSIRKISPLNSLRVSFEPNLVKDAAKWLIYILILAFILLFTRMQLEGWPAAISFTVGVVVAFLVLTAIAALLTWLVRRFFPSSWSFVWRQGLANLYRPNNQTGTLIVSIGLGTALICTMFFIQNILLNRVTLSASGNQPNIVLFDIQPAQRDSVLHLARQQGLAVNGTVPLVNMRLESVNNYNAEVLRNDSTIQMHTWIFNREYRVTYRDSIISSEKIADGKWVGRADPSVGPVPISLEKNFAKNNSIKIGDTMRFNVQGAVIPTVVSSLRTVDWNRVQTNFLVVFPAGVLEDAPQFHVLMTHVPTVEA